MSKEQILKSKQHFIVLDGMRGIAALAIVIFHFTEWVYEPSKNFICHGFLAVDFFFCLSGFVIAYAYVDRLKNIGLKSFFISRLIRLQPMVILGSVLGLIAFLIDPFAVYQFTYSYAKIIVLFLCSLFLIPFPSMEERSFNLFGLNAPAWSLFWEYIANIFYALVLIRFSKKLLFIILIPAAFGLFYLSLTTGNLSGGWAGSNFWHGGLRIAYSFTAGMIVFRFQWILKNKLNFWVLSLLLAMAFVSPHFFDKDIIEALIVVFYFPVLVSLGAGSIAQPKTKKLSQFFGEISYPLYMTHYAFIWIFGNYFLKNHPDTKELTFIVIFGIIIMLVFAWLVMKFYDIPVRKYLTKLRQRSIGN